MGIPVKILIVEDEMLIAANIAMQLQASGYQIVAIYNNGEDAIDHIKRERPDLVLMDIQLKGELDGIATAAAMQAHSAVPVIYLTANSDETHFNLAKFTNPYAFLSKPFKKDDLQYAIDLASTKILELNNSPSNNREEYVLTDRIFVKHNNSLSKIIIQDIFYLEAERNYCRIFTKSNQYLLVNPLRAFEDKLPGKYFFRIHRSFIVNLFHIDEVGLADLKVNNMVLPLTRQSREDLLQRLQTI